LEVWQNSAIFGGRPISAAVEALEETHLAMVSVPESDFLSKKGKHKVTHLFNGNFKDFCETFSLGQSQR
jgi:hypothetical protein